MKNKQQRHVQYILAKLKNIDETYRNIEYINHALVILNKEVVKFKSHNQAFIFVASILDIKKKLIEQEEKA